QERVLLALEALGRELVGAEVERPYDERPPAEPRDRVLVGRVVLLLARVGVLFVVEELGAVEPDAERAVADRLVDLLGELDIGVEPELVAVERLAGELALLVERLPEAGELLL